MHVVFLDIYRAFDAAPYDEILRHLRRSGGSRRMLLYIETIFFSEMTSRVNICSTLSSLRKVSQWVPQGSVLNPLLFNLGTLLGQDAFLLH